MLMQSLRRRILSETLELQIVRWLLVGCALFIPGYGFLKMVPLELAPKQWFLGLGIIIALVLQCVILLALTELRIERNRKGA